MTDLFPQISIGLIAFSFTSLSIVLIPISKQATSWNQCVKKTSATLTQVKGVEKMNDESMEVLSVMICNGAVFEPTIKTIIK